MAHEGFKLNIFTLFRLDEDSQQRPDHLSEVNSLLTFIYLYIYCPGRFLQLTDNLERFSILVNIRRIQEVRFLDRTISCFYPVIMEVIFVSRFGELGREKKTNERKTMRTHLH